jgi:hypothetical protein
MPDTTQRTPERTSKQASDLTTTRAVTVAVSPYESIAAQRTFEARLSDLGFSRQILLDKMVRVELYQRK